jgi:hypothetical protein
VKITESVIGHGEHANWQLKSEIPQQNIISNNETINIDKISFNQPEIAQ